MSDILSPAEVNDLMDGFPVGFLEVAGRGKRPVDLSELLVEWGPLTADDVQAAQAHVEAGSPSLGVITSSPLQRLRQNHHRLAQYLSMGMSDIQAGALCNYSANRISILRNDPAFRELLAHYAANQKEEFSDFVAASADLSLDMVAHLREMLETAPERITPTIALEAIRTLADRSGNAPLTRTANLNVNIGMGDKMEGIRERLRRVGT